MSIKYTIDGVEVEALEGETILASATRAGVEIPTSATASKDAFRDYLRLERGHELFGEGIRRQDLIRFMCSDGRNVYNGTTWFCHKNKADNGDWHNNVFPIYYEFVQSNVNIKQNYGFVDEAETEQPAG